MNIAVNGGHRDGVLSLGSLNGDAPGASNHWATENEVSAVKTVTARVMRGIAVVLVGMAVASAPGLTYAQHFGGGGHVSGGHFSGGGHYSGGHAFGGRGGVAHFAAPHYYSGARYGGAAHYSAAGHYAAPLGAGHGYLGAHAVGAGGAHFARTGSAFVRGGYYGGHYWFGGHYWGGGYWGGAFWPHVWFYPGWAWFLPTLPFGYATFWWGGVPYYYYNSLYYTWNPNYDGYVVTDPPPAAGSDYSADNPGDAGSAPQYDYSQAAPPANAGPAASPPAAGAPVQPRGASDLYLYPRNGQSDTQTQNDRYECHSWALNQTGFDPTRSAQQASGNAADYRRAMIACLDARGYSAR
jgi:hypothetical protein